MCLVVALLPAIPLSFLVKTLLEKSLDLGLSQTVEEALQSGLGVSRAHLGALHDDFENAVSAVVERHPGGRVDSTTVANALADDKTAGSIDGFLTAGAAGAVGLETPLSLPGELAGFERDLVLAELTGGKEALERTEHTGIHMFHTTNRSVQMALWTPDPVGSSPATQDARTSPPVLFYKQTDPEFMAQAQQILEGRQIFAQLRLEQPTLNRSFFYPFVLIYGVILLLSLAFALLMAERLSNPIRRLAQGAGVVAQGDWTYRLKTGAGGEIGHLVTAFNNMVSRLDSQRRRLIDMEKMTAWREVARHLAHEIKNPLLPIRLTVEEMKDQYKGGDPDYQTLVDDSARVVGEEIDHLQALVKEFSSFARMPELKPRRASLESLLRDVAKLYAQVPVRVDADTAVGDSTFDPDQMRRVLVNLMDNAAATVKEIPNPAIRVSLSRTGDEAILEVSDNGSGISPANLQRVFEPYFTTKSEGSGLGLAMVKNIVLLHGGTIDVSSEAGEGTTFAVALPLEGPRSAGPGGPGHGSEASVASKATGASGAHAGNEHE
jgi:nitrogen fixation/metabolism regulation signal transduction histidine kinase